MRLCRNRKKVWCVFMCLSIFCLLCITGCQGTVIYTSVESQVLLAETEEAVIPYLKYVEG